MPRKQKYFYLLEKSVNAAISAIEIYNKPDFKYREESFSILIVNAWETLLKAKIVSNNKNNLKSIYLTEAKRKDGQQRKKNKYIKNRTNNYKTIDIFAAIKKLNLEKILGKNIELLVEIRDNSIHFFNKSKSLNKKILEIGTASLKSYVQCCNDWFSYDLTKYNFYLMPISFFHSYEVTSFSIEKEEPQYKNLLKYITEKEKKYPSDVKQKHNISLTLETKFTKSKSMESIPFRYDKNNPEAIPVNISAEDDFKNKFPWNYTDDLIPKLKKRYIKFTMNIKFHNLKKEIEKNEKLCGKRYLNLETKKGASRKFYSPNILIEFDKHYKRKEQDKNNT